MTEEKMFLNNSWKLASEYKEGVITIKVNLVNENFTESYLSNLLAARGVTDIDKYLNPNESCLNSPALLDNIEKGSLLFEEVLKKENSHILIIVD